MKINIFYILLISNAIIFSGRSQNITVDAKIDTSLIVIGAQTTLTFELTQKKNQKVLFPQFNDTITGALEIVESPKADTTASDADNILIRKRYVVTSFNDSLLYIPPYPFVQGEDTVWTRSLSLKVVQPFQIDTTSNQIADIKQVMDPPINWKAILRIALMVILVLIVLIVVYFLVRKYIFKKPIFESEAPEVILPSYVVALNQLEKIRGEKAWLNNRAKEYHTELTDVLRTYIEKTFDVPCMEMTSEEIISNMNHLRFENKKAYTSLTQILKLADLVKFAKWEASSAEHEQSLANAIEFVNETKIEEEQVITTDEESDKEQETL